MATLSTRLEDWLRDAVIEFWRAHGEGPSGALRHVVEEWWAMQEFPAIEFRDGVSGRRAVVKVGPDVWEVVRVARDYGADREGLHAHFAPYVDPAALDQALAYAARFPDEIEAMLADNERLENFLKRRTGT